MNNHGSRETSTSTMARRRRARPLHEAREVELSPEDAAAPERRAQSGRAHD